MLQKIFINLFIVFFLFLVGCNILPKSMQYQKEEERLIGSTEGYNPKIEEVQFVLKEAGYETGTTDGRIGKETRNAIKEFQESLGLKSTGYLDETSLSQIEQLKKTKEALTKKYKVTVKEAPEGKAIVSAKDIQTALKNAGFDPGPIDGKIGPKTRQAIREFQRSKGLTPDGVVGPKTWVELGEYLKETKSKR